MILALAVSLRGEMNPYASSSLAFIFITAIIAFSGTNGTEVTTKEDALDKKGICKIADVSFNIECNKCICGTVGSPPGCTKIYCLKSQIRRSVRSLDESPLSAVRPWPEHRRLIRQDSAALPLITKENALDSNGKCIRNGSFKDDCNSCMCVKGSHAACTLMYCGPVKAGRSIRSLDISPLSAVDVWPELRRHTRQGTAAIPLITKENSLDSNGICIRNGTFGDGCNTCNCVKGSHAACTLMNCDPVVMIPREEALDEKGVCKKKGMIKDELDCNTCECIPGSVPNACTEMVCERKV